MLWNGTFVCDSFINILIDLKSNSSDNWTKIKHVMHALTQTNQKGERFDQNKNGPCIRVILVEPDFSPLGGS